MLPRPSLPPPKNRSLLRDLLFRVTGRQLLTWLLLVLMFVGLQVVFARPGGQREVEGWLLGVSVLLGAAVLGIIVWSAVLGRLARKASAAAQAGDEPQALALYRTLERRARGPLRQAAWLNLAYLLFHRGELDDGLAYLGRAERSHGPLLQAYGQTVADRLSLGLALRGDLANAAGWVEQARRRSPGRGLLKASLHLVAEAILANRRGDAAGAQRLVEAAWPEVERTTVAAQLRPLHVVRAYLATAAGVPPTGALALAVTSATGHAWLGEGWPELAAWIAAQGPAA